MFHFWITTIRLSCTINCVTLLLLIFMFNGISTWMPDVHSDSQPKRDVIISRFFGNTSDYFKILAHDESTILVGARDIIYNISLNGLRELSRLEWSSSDADRELCALKGKHDDDCHNYLRVFAHTAVDEIMVCGTNSYKPRCHHYAIHNSSVAPQRYELVKDVEAQGICPYSPSHNSTYIYTDGQLYSATVADFSGSDPLIYRENLRTEQYDLKQLNQPDFVGAIERNGYVMFFFREISMEYMNCGKVVYSRVGRVCKNDRGGPYTLSKSWTSFLKTRLNCSVPGEYPFYFDEIQAISNIIETGSIAIIYAVFTTSANAIPGSAICAFYVDDISAAFEGRFKSQKDSQSNWLPIQHDDVPGPRPGQCVDDSRTLSSTSVNFVKNHPLMETAVAAMYGRPLLTKVNLHHRLTAIAIDSHVMALNGKYYDLIFTGTDDGKIIKFINVPTGDSDNSDDVMPKTVLISEHQVLAVGVAVRELFVDSKSNTLVVVSDGGLVSVPLHHCTYIYDCQSCLSLQDPKCAWDLQNRECKSLDKNNKFGTKTFLQSLNGTKKVAAAHCPKMSMRGMSKVPLVANGGEFNVNERGSAVVNKNNNSVTSGILTKTPETVDDAMPILDINQETNIIGINGITEFADKNGGKLNMGNNGIFVTDNTHVGGGGFIIDGFNNDNQITLTSDTNGLKNTLNNDPYITEEIVDKQKLQLAGKSFYWGFAIVILALVFIIGMFVGLYTSRRMCKATDFHSNHRNQLVGNTPHPPFLTQMHHRNSGKDVNLLVNSIPFVPFNQKKANVDIVGEKDRSHECKNSTENLEKELPCKTSTLTKVKRTYI